MTDALPRRIMIRLAIQSPNKQKIRIVRPSREMISTLRMIAPIIRLAARSVARR